MAAGAATTVTSSNPNAASRMLSNRDRRSLWVSFQADLPVEGMVARREPSPTPIVEEAEPSVRREAPPEAGTPTPTPKRSGIEKIELAIDKLPNHELIKPIPVLIESLGDKVFIAEVPGLDISISGSSMGGVLLQLKEHIANIYEGHRVNNNLKPEGARQLKALESYIGKTRRNWF
ncbi:MAG TPA: hypothetical protein VE687_18520 [Stellaceae bacterium]|nr:hypothetical protein [Stellaceae bacterium]